MPDCIFTTNHHCPPPKTTATCCSLKFSAFLPSSIGFPRAKFGYTVMNSSYRRTSTVRNRVVICMAKERRVKMVAKQIQRELSDMLLTDQVLQYAILPEAALGADRYLSSLTTISDVEVSSDLQVIAILDKIKSEKKTIEHPVVESSDPTENWDDENGDDIIYVK